ncbi:hypothetical protein ACTG2K_08240 [Aeromonas caviae]
MIISFGIALELSTCASNGNDIFLKERLETTIEKQVKIINRTEKYGLLKGLNKQSSISEKSQNGFLHQDIGISCTARIKASGKYEPIKTVKADRILNCINYYHFDVLPNGDD